MGEEVHIIFSKFPGLEANSRQLYYQMNSFTDIFRQHFKPPCSPYVLTEAPSPPHQILTADCPYKLLGEMVTKLSKLDILT